MYCHCEIFIPFGPRGGLRSCAPPGRGVPDAKCLRLSERGPAKSRVPWSQNAQVLRIANGPGERVTTFAEGVAALRAGKAINYEGASSSVEFKPDGSLLSRDFELYEIKGGRDVSVERITSAA